ncbi:MAG: aspartate aminotransferase family protein [Janthinobacterium lividum]
MLPAPPDETPIARRMRLLGPAYRLFYEEPLHIVRGAGAWLYDADGRRYLDAYNNVAAVGHAHPQVVDAIARQAAVLNTHTRYLHEGVLDYAERLLGTMPAAIGHTIFTCTGSEANDLAMRIARAFTGNDGLVVTRFAYHGVTESIATASPSLGPYVRLGEHVRTVPAPDSHRVPPDRLGAFFADGVRAAIADLRAHGRRPAALLVDTVFSSDGVYTDPPGFLREAVAVVRAAGGLFIADEVQPGLGRTGDAFWGFQRHGVVPDIVTMGKPMGNGHPLAGLAVKPDVLAPFARQSRYFNTFGGNPVSVAAGMAVLDVIEREGLVANARLVGEYLRTRLRAVATRHPRIRDVRGAGLFVGVEFGNDDGEIDAAVTARVRRVVNGMREQGVLLNATGPDANILKIRPPMVFDIAQADLLVETLEDVMRQAPA